MSMRFTCIISKGWAFSLLGFSFRPVRITFSMERESKTLTRNESDSFSNISSDILPTKAEQINVNKECQYPKFSPVPEEEQLVYPVGAQRDMLGWDNKASMALVSHKETGAALFCGICHRIPQNTRVEMSFNA